MPRVPCAGHSSRWRRIAVGVLQARAERSIALDVFGYLGAMRGGAARAGDGDAAGNLNRAVAVTGPNLPVCLAVLS